MKNIQLPSDKRFGIFFAVVFLAIAVYCFFIDNNSFFYLFLIASAILAVIATIRATLLRPLNKAWMKMGFILGSVITPLILSLIYFLIITPIAFIVRVAGRDELRLKSNSKDSYWIDTSTKDIDFDKQY